jgi:hypothetical protein
MTNPEFVLTDEVKADMFSVLVTQLGKIYDALKMQIALADEESEEILVHVHDDLKMFLSDWDPAEWLEHKKRQEK